MVNATRKQTREPDETPAGVHKHEHAIAGAATLSGAAAGAVIGAMAGPIGAVAGGVIGTAVGAVAGLTMEREDHRTEAHDRELDDVIGVSGGDIGEPEENKRPSQEILFDVELDEAMRRGEEAP